VSQGQSENIVPGFPHELQQYGDIPFRYRLFCIQAIFAHEPAGFGRNTLLVNARHFALNKGTQPAF
jgi:hypothetical protein